MKKKSIYVNDQGELLLIEYPDNVDFSDLDINLHPEVKHSIKEHRREKEAIANGTKIKDQESAKKIISDSNKGTLAHYAIASGQTFPLPDNVTIKFQIVCDELCGGTCIECKHGKKVAILSYTPAETGIFTIDRRHDGDKCITKAKTERNFIW